MPPIHWRLIVAERNNQHGPAGPHRLGRGADPSLMHHHRGAREEAGVGNVVDGDHARRQARRPVTRVPAGQQHGPAAKHRGGLGALLVEGAGLHHDGAVSGFLDLLHDRVAVQRALGERQEDLEHVWLEREL